jgi:putative DNA primase/helicase
MKDDDARSGEERPLLAVVEGESGQDVGETPPIAGQDRGCCVDGKSSEPSATDGPPTGPSCAPGDGPVLFSIEGGKWVPGGLSSLRRLTSNSTADEVNSAVREWAAHVVVLPPVERVTQRLEALRVLHAVGIHSAAALADAGIAEATMALARMLSERSASPSMSGEVEEVRPWPEAVDGRELASEIEAVLRKYVVLPGPNDLLAVILWLLAAHAHDCFNVFPILLISSPVMRAGKTTLLMLLSVLVPRVFYTTDTTAPALFEVTTAIKPTILIDEADCFLKGNESLRGFFNAGHVKFLATVTRVRGKFSAWTPKVLAAIGRMPSTIEDRSVVIRMERRTADERVEQLRLDRVQEYSYLGMKAARWAEDCAEEIRTADPAMPDEIRSSRARDNVRPLLAIADVIGGDLPCRAREAAIALCRADEMLDEDRDTLLLKDMAELYRTRGADRIESLEIVRSLVAMPDRPWVDFNHGEPLRAVDLARVLMKFGVFPRKWADGARRTRRRKRGYWLSDLRDKFARYVSPEQAEAPPAPTKLR